MKTSKLNDSILLSKEILALKLLDSYLPVSTYLPYSSSSLSFESIRLILNDIFLNNRTNILEFGSGISTLIIAKFLSSLKIKASFISVDENKEWVELLNEIIEREKISFVKIIHQELILEKNHKYNYWYNPVTLKQAIPKNLSLILIDGPSAWQKERKFARKPAIDFLLNNNLLRLDNYAIYLDDCNRNGELEILKQWGSKLGKSFNVINQTLGRISHNDKFNIQ